MRLYKNCQTCGAKLPEDRTGIARFFYNCDACSEKARKKREEDNKHKIRITKEDLKGAKWIGAGDETSASQLKKELPDGNILVVGFRRSYETAQILHDSIWAKITSKSGYVTVEENLHIEERLLFPWQW